MADATQERDDAPPNRNKATILLSATATLIGIALSIVGSDGLGGMVTVAGFVMLALSLHRFGRSGPE